MNKVKIFSKSQFSILWWSGSLSSFGDWATLFASVALASQLGSETGNSGITAVVPVVARIIPAFLSSFAGLMADRMNKKNIMIFTDLSRMLIVLFLFFATSLVQLFIVNFLTEIFSLMRQPSRESIVPEIVHKENLVKANSLFAIGTYATLPIASILFALIADIRVPDFISNFGNGWSGSIIFIFDAFTFFDAGSHGIYGGRLKDINYRIRLKNALLVSKHLDIPLIRVKTNVYRLLKGEFKSAHSFLNLSCAIAIGLKKAKYYYASAYSTEQSNLKKGDTSNYDHLILPLIKYDKFEAHPSVINLKRIERIKALSDDDLAQRYLDVCLSSFKSGALNVINCSSCDKCLRTALTLKSIGKLHLFYGVFDLKLIEEQDALEKDGLEVLLSRTREKAMRLALICALADDHNTNIIRSDITKWAIDYVYYYDQLLVDNCEDKVAGSETESKIKQVLSFIRSQGDIGISKRDIDRREIFRSMKSYEVKEIIERLKNSGEIQEKDVKTKTTGRPTKRIVAIDPEFFDD